eukprot:scaffold1893_cov220-Amphora_coffeaeformis.AAC.21
MKKSSSLHSYFTNQYTILADGVICAGKNRASFEPEGVCSWTAIPANPETQKPCWAVPCPIHFGAAFL